MIGVFGCYAYAALFKAITLEPVMPARDLAVSQWIDGDAREALELGDGG